MTVPVSLSSADFDVVFESCSSKLVRCRGTLVQRTNFILDNDTTNNFTDNRLTYCYLLSKKEKTKDDNYFGKQRKYNKKELTIFKNTTIASISQFLTTKDYQVLSATALHLKI